MSQDLNTLTSLIVSVQKSNKELQQSNESLITLIVLFLIGILIYIYIQFYSSTDDDNYTSPITEIVYFKTDACPFCKEVDPAWIDFAFKHRDMVRTKVINLSHDDPSLQIVYNVTHVPAFRFIHQNGKISSYASGFDSELMRSIIRRSRSSD